MRKFLLPMLALGMLLGGAKVARAGFFDACLAPGEQTITVVQDTTVRNERATFQTDGSGDDCTVVVNDGVRLRLVSVTIDVVGDEFIEFEGGDTSSLSIESSTINACDADISGFGQVRIASSKILDPPNVGFVMEKRSRLQVI